MARLTTSTYPWHPLLLMEIPSMYINWIQQQCHIYGVFMIFTPKKYGKILLLSQIVTKYPLKSILKIKIKMSTLKMECHDSYISHPWDHFRNLHGEVHLVEGLHLSILQKKQTSQQCSKITLVTWNMKLYKSWLRSREPWLVVIPIYHPSTRVVYL